MAWQISPSCQYRDRDVSGSMVIFLIYIQDIQWMVNISDYKVLHQYSHCVKLRRKQRTEITFSRGAPHAFHSGSEKSVGSSSLKSIRKYSEYDRIQLKFKTKQHWENIQRTTYIFGAFQYKIVSSNPNIPPLNETSSLKPLLTIVIVTNHDKTI